MAKGGARPGAGNPGYGKLLFLKTKVEELSPLWFEQVEKMMKSKNIGDKKFALAELNKLQVKMIPQQVGGIDDKPIKLQWQLSQSPMPQGAGPTPSTTQSSAG